MERRFAPERLARAAVFAAGCLVVAAAAGGAAAAETRSRQPMVDPAVVPAGGCRTCGHAHGGVCRGHGHHAGCRDGKCHPYCPVRPQEFGFYGTQWRRWPGQGVVPVSDVRAATPALPPKSAVPSADEESREPRADELPEPGEGADGGSAKEEPRETPRQEPSERASAQPRAGESAQPAAPPEPNLLPPEPESTSQPAPVEPQAPPEPPAAERTAPVPEQTPAEPKPLPRDEVKPAPADEDLFDESAVGPVRRRFAASRAAIPPAAGAPRPRSVTPAALERPIADDAVRPAPRQPAKVVPRVPFDPTTESARLRSR